MTKKLTLIAIALLAIAPFANAAFYIDGSDLNNIKWGSTVEIAPAGGLEMYWALLVDAGSLSDTSAVALKSGTGFDLVPFGDISGAGTAGIGTWGTLFTTGGAISSGDLFSGFVASGPVATISLVQILPDFSGYANDGAPLATYSVPEPITVALLGLGGLFVARKNKK